MTVGMAGVGATALTAWWKVGPRDPDRHSQDPAVWAEELLAAGVAPQDVDAYEARRVAEGLSAEMSARALVWDLRALYECWPRMTVRDALGWMLVFPTKGPVVVSVRPWVAVVGESGWLFAAAGLSLTEALGQVKAGSADVDALAALAGLRGVPAPVTA